ncbi:MAG: hypothetical protein HIU90_17130 [Proteobacteria bacterium]|nr:hypothetical protein [Pseudomonadota bacterium]
MTDKLSSTKTTAGCNSPRLVDIAAQAKAAAHDLAALGSTPSERRIIAAVAAQAMRAVFAEAGR